MANQPEPLAPANPPQETPEQKRDRIAAQARINGSKSHGPVTIEGKAKSSKNAIKHGHACEVNVVLHIEESEEFEIHVAKYHACFNPADYFESELVDELAAISWRKSRLRCSETALIDFQLSVQEDKMNANFPAEVGNASLHLAFALQGLARKPLARLVPDSEPVDPTVPPEELDSLSIELVRRYITTCDRQFRTAMVNLRQYRKDLSPAATTATHRGADPLVPALEQSPAPWPPLDQSPVPPSEPIPEPTPSAVQPKPVPHPSPVAQQPASLNEPAKVVTITTAKRTPIPPEEAA